AAGLTIKKESFEAFSRKFEEIVDLNTTEELLTPEIEYDLEIGFEDINSKFFKLLDQFRPHGPGNMIPVFRSNQLKDAGSRIVKEKHLKVAAVQDGIKFDGIGFNMSDAYSYVKQGDFDMCYSVEINE